MSNCSQLFEEYRTELWLLLWNDSFTKIKPRELCPVHQHKLLEESSFPVFILSNDRILSKNFMCKLWTLCQWIWKICQFYTMYSPVSRTLRESHHPQLTFGLFIYKHTSICALLYTYAPAHMHLSTCICTCMYMYICTHTVIHIHLHTHAHAYIWSHTYILTYTCIHTCTCTHSCSHSAEHTQAHTCLCTIHMYLHTQTPTHTCTFTHMHTHMYLHKTLVYMCNCTHTNILLYSFELKETAYSLEKVN